METQRYTTLQPDLFKRLGTVSLEPDQRRIAVATLVQLMTAVVGNGDQSPLSASVSVEVDPKSSSRIVMCATISNRRRRYQGLVEGGTCAVAFLTAQRCLGEAGYRLPPAG